MNTKGSKTRKSCKNMQLYVRDKFGVKLPCRHNYMLRQKDIASYLLCVGVDPKGKPNDNFSDEYTMRNDDMNINGVDCFGILLEKSGEDVLFQRRQSLLRADNYDYNPLTGDVETIESIEKNMSYEVLGPTEKINRQKKLDNRRN